MSIKLVLLLLFVNLAPLWAFTVPKAALRFSNNVNNLKCFHLVRTIMRPSYLKHNILKMSTVDDEEIATDSLPDKSKFESFYNSIASNNEITLDKLLKYSEIESLVSDGLLYMDDINDLWQSATGDSNTLNCDEAYEFLCMLVDIPDPEDIEYFTAEFKKISNNKDTISFYQLLGWSDIQEILTENVLSMEDLTNLYRKTVGDLNKSMNDKLFTKFNLQLDDIIDDKENDIITSEKVNEKDEISSKDEDGGINAVNSKNDVSNINVFDPSFVPENAFDAEVLIELQNFFNSNIDTSNKLLPKEKFLNWSDIQDILNEGIINRDQINNAWNKASDNKNFIDYNNFLRLNIQIDLLLDENDNKSVDKVDTKIDSEEDAETYYTNIFKSLTNNNNVITLSDLLKWDEIQDLIDDSVISTKQIINLFESYPQIKSNNGNVGIDINSFILFNNMLDIMLDSKVDNKVDSKVESKVNTVAAPTILSEPSRPLPKVTELKIGSLNENNNDNDNPELTPEELELLQVLDKADSLLNSGSFGDFDKLIGDENDPRLDIIKSTNTTNLNKNKEINEIINNILILSKKQSKCGIGSSPDDIDIIQLRDNCQLLYEIAPKVNQISLNQIKKTIIGKWRLLYTNSEMFTFYNGITGLTNVFPGTNFNSLDIEYISDGYLNEIKYYEKLTTPIGETLATVFANYDLLKENSFITNDMSVMVRGYCTKVIAGPLSYRAEENWKSLRTFAMNEIIYIDDKFMLMRNAGALRIYFVLERIFE